MRRLLDTVTPCNVKIKTNRFNSNIEVNLNTPFFKVIKIFYARNFYKTKEKYKQGSLYSIWSDFCGSGFYYIFLFYDQKYLF